MVLHEYGGGDCEPCRKKALDLKLSKPDHGLQHALSRVDVGRQERALGKRVCVYRMNEFVWVLFLFYYC